MSIDRNPIAARGHHWPGYFAGDNLVEGVPLRESLRSPRWVHDAILEQFDRFSDPR